MKRSDLIEEISSLIVLIERPHPIRVAIDGVDAAGKTTLADELADPIKTRGRAVIRASVDGFHNPRHIRYRLGADSPEGYYRDSFDYETLKAVLLDPLGPGGSLQYRSGYVPGQRLYLNECRPAERADILVDNNDLRTPSIRHRSPNAGSTLIQ